MSSFNIVSFALELSLFLALVFTFACESQIDDLESQRPVSSVATTEANGVVTATISASATVDQTLVASQNSKVADASVTFPPGALSVNTEIALGEAKDQSTEILATLGVSGLVDKGAPVVVGPTDTANQVNVSQPLTIQLPIPIEKLNSSGTGLAESKSKLMLIYTIYQDGWKSGIIPITSESLIGAFLKEALSGMGYFQIVGLAISTEKKEVLSQIVPELGENTAAEETANTGTGALSDYVGFYAGTVTEVSNTANESLSGNQKYCALTNENFKLWLSAYNILTFKVGTPIPASENSAFDGDVGQLGSIENQEAGTIAASNQFFPSRAATTDEGLMNSGVKFSFADLNQGRGLKYELSGGFSGSSSKVLNATLSATIGETKVCEYTLALTKT